MQQLNVTKLLKPNDVWYKLIKYLPEHNVTNKGGIVNMEMLAAWRDYVGADHVLRDQMGFMLCETVTDAVIVDEENTVEPTQPIEQTMSTNE